MKQNCRYCGYCFDAASPFCAVRIVGLQAPIRQGNMESIHVGIQAKFPQVNEECELWKRWSGLVSESS